MHYTSHQNHLTHACIHINGRIEICRGILGVGHAIFRLEWIGYAAQCKCRRPRSHAPVLAVPQIVHEMSRASDVAAPVSAHVGNMFTSIPTTATCMSPCMCTCTTICTVCMQMRMFNNLHDVQAGVHVTIQRRANRGYIGVCRNRIGRPSRRARRHASLCI